MTDPNQLHANWADSLASIGECINAEATVAFTYNRATEGSVPDANGIAPVETVTINLPMADIVPMPPPLYLSGPSNAALLRVYAGSSRKVGYYYADMLFTEVKRGGLVL
ncbi:MAG: hypothetical protein M3N02_06780 [Pseudomonadota bacterium]|nr:hypothetical protein [Pseudomonadota bacterium]